MFQIGKAKTGGRKKGVKNKSNHYLLLKAEEYGISPLDMILKIMNIFCEEARRCNEPDRKLKLYMMTAKVASKALPYCHRKMPVAVEVRDTTKETFEETIIRLEKEAEAARTKNRD
jgi:hypothetical protein